MDASFPTEWWTALADGRVQCDVCPRRCRLHAGQRGLCFVRANQDDQLVLTTYGRSSGFVVDPIEKKPLHHFLPGTSVLSFGTAGCNLACRFCQNWDISKSRETDVLADAGSPERIAHVAQQQGCASVAFTYNDPVVFLEYAADTADACHEIGVRTVAVSAGYIEPGPREQLFSRMDAANIDLKAFTDDFYRHLCGARLGPVLDTLEWLAEQDVWLEVTTLLLPGLNDSDAELHLMADWFAEHLGADVPWHFTAFHPDFRMGDHPPTPPATLTRARRIAMQHGIHHVYTGNVHDTVGGSTSCSSCHAELVIRDWHRIEYYAITDDGQCSACGAAVPGVFDGPVGHWGARRQPVRLTALTEEAS
ncbi:MAG: AmmeMemoRadiSam system radical SAM enzyme [Actinobacteria bacterium]|nr:AmmeMemoRadiSam system radical SAM enzyme [Actinomycetota bacterium]